MITVGGVRMSLIPVATPRMVNYVRSTWLGRLTKRVRGADADSDTIVDAVRLLVDALMPHVRVLVADDPDVAHAWICVDPSSRQWGVYVAGPLRGMGVEEMMREAFR